MRLIRPFLAAPIGIVLLTSLAGAVVAQSPGPWGAATFTATSVLEGEYVENVVLVVDGASHVRADATMIWTATDPRASGTANFGINRIDHPGATVHAGTFRLDGDQGSWVGTFSGFWDAAGRHYLITADGQGGFEGWTLLADDVCRCDSPTTAASGVIVPGELPSSE